MINYSALIASNQQRWDTAVFKPSFRAMATKVAARLVAQNAKAQYQAIESATGVPWWVIAVIHEREASQKWNANIAQGDPWNRRSVNDPSGRGPFKSFYDAAVDALVNCGPYASRWKDWSAGGALTLLELYNGLGYENQHHMASPYLWSGTQHYIRGKYIADHQFSSTQVDTQLGCAVMLSEMRKLDSSIEFTGDAVGLAAPAEEPNPDEYPDPDATPNNSVPAPPPPPASTKVITARTIAASVAGVEGASQVVKGVVGDVSDVADQVTTVADKSGQVIAVTKQAVAIPKPGFWNGTLHFITSPWFIVVSLLIIAGAWGLVWVWQRHHKPPETT